MNAVIETGTGRVIYLFDANVSVIIGAAGMVSPLRALDIRPETHMVQPVDPPPVWIGGGVLSWSAGTWGVADSDAYADLVLEQTETNRAAAMRSIVDHINIITASALTAYPAAEVESWPIQKAEAETILATDPPTLAMAPFLVGVCMAQFGPADDDTRLAQVIEKAGAVKENADTWAAMAAYVNGLRARTQLAILGAADVAGIEAALAAGVAEGDAFREANGL